jgi:hypothetical protein
MSAAFGSTKVEPGFVFTKDYGKNFSVIRRARAGCKNLLYTDSEQNE